MTKLFCFLAIFLIEGKKDLKTIDDVEQIKYLSTLENHNLETAGDTITYFLCDSGSFYNHNYKLKIGNKVFQALEPFKRSELSGYTPSDSMEIISNYFLKEDWLNDQYKIKYYLMGYRRKIEILEKDFISGEYITVKSLTYIRFFEEDVRNIEINIIDNIKLTHEVVRISTSEEEIDYIQSAKSGLRKIALLNDYERRDELERLARYLMKISFI
jgi:hypothetical protein